MRNLRLITLLFAVLPLLALPPAAAADGKEVIRDCARDGDLDGNYSQGELRNAYNNLPTDIDEYSNCRDVIRQALAAGQADRSSGGLGAAGGSGYGGGGGYQPGGYGGASGSGTPSDRAELDRRVAEAREGVTPFQDDRTAAARAALARDDSGLPAAAIVAIILLVLGAIGGGLYMLRDRLPPTLTSRIPGLRPGQGA